MKRITKFLVITLLCSFLAGSMQTVMAQETSNPKNARAQDSSDWGLLGLIGLIGLLGLRKKDRDE
ncbi:MAG: WGxxGxxG family protein [Chryseosolibacter sp.]